MRPASTDPRRRPPIPILLIAAGMAAAGCGGLLDSVEEGAGSTETGAGPDDGGGSVGSDNGGDGGTAGAGTVRAPSDQRVEVDRLSDGDSGVIVVDGEQIEFRLLGYNAPERFEGDGGPLSCNGAAAEAALDEALTSAGDALRFVGAETDRFGRTLGDFVVDGRSVVDGLIDGGWGLATGDNAGRELMEGAASAGRGLWGDGCGRPAADGIVVTRVEADPPGRDEDDLNGEIVELLNDGPEPIDLTGWDIRDDSSSHRFDLAGTLAPGETLVIRTGSGSSGRGELYLDSPSPVWSNRGDTTLVIDPDGVVAAWAFVIDGSGP